MNISPIAIYKNLLAALVILTTGSAWADPAPLGLELGVAKVEDIAQKLPSAKTRNNGPFGGPFYTYEASSPTSKIQSALFHFDEKGQLASATVFIAKDRWDMVLAGIAQKYKRSKYVFRRNEVTAGKVYLPPHIPLMRASADGQYVFEDGGTIIYANSQGASLNYSTMAVLPKMAAHVEKLRTDRLKAITNDL